VILFLYAFPSIRPLARLKRVRFPPVVDLRRSSVMAHDPADFPQVFVLRPNPIRVCASNSPPSGAY